MENLDDLTIHFTINNIAILILQLIIIVSSIVIVTKYKSSVGAKIMLIGSVLTLMCMIAFQAVPIFMNLAESTDYLKVQVLLSYLNTFTLFVFMIGVAIFAIIDLKKEDGTV